MALGLETPRISYVGNDSTTVFPLSFTYSNSSDVEVYLDDVLQSSGYTVNSADVTFTTAPATGFTVTLLRNTPLDQPAPFSDPQKLTLAEIENSFDRAIRQNQDIYEKIERSPILPPSSNSVSRANTTVGFDENGRSVARTSAEQTAHLGLTEKIQEVNDHANEAATSAAASQASADQAAADVATIGTSLIDAQTAATNAATSETNAANSAAAAAASAASITDEEANSASSATAASDSRDAAATSATAAATSESNATTQANAAAQYASNASTSETNAAQSAQDAANSATAASQSYDLQHIHAVTDILFSRDTLTDDEGYPLTDDSGMPITQHAFPALYMNSRYPA